MKAKGKIDFAAIDRPDGERVVRITVTAGGVIKHTFDLTEDEFREEMYDLEKSVRDLDDVKVKAERAATVPKTPKPAPPVDPGEKKLEKLLAESNEVIEALKAELALAKKSPVAPPVSQRDLPTEKDEPVASPVAPAPPSEPSPAS